VFEQLMGVLHEQVRQQVKKNKGSKINLGTLGGSTSIAYGINNVGKVVGYSETSRTYAISAD
jgi:uncharacterized membrane protein